MADYENDGMNENGFHDNDDSFNDNGINHDSFSDDDSLNDNNKSDQDNSSYDDSSFEAPDVSEPRAPVREIDVIEEALAIRRRDWIKTHLSYIYAGVGIIVVILIALLIHMLFQNSNPMSRFTSSISKNFNSSFQFDVQMTEDDESVMRYTGAVDVNRSKHTAKAAFEADYNRYQFSQAVYADKDVAKKGSYYQKQWLVRDCLDNAQDFFDFDRDFRSGTFDGGAFLRFTGLTSDFSTRELNAFVNTLMKRMSTDSAIAQITTEKVDGEEHIHYDISLQNLFEMVKNDGASIFYRATDYDAFCENYELNKGVIEDATFTVDFTVNGSGNMSYLEAKIVVGGKAYGMTCRMSDFGEASVEIPQGFLKAAEITTEE